jgi:cell volume regulation protein A
MSETILIFGLIFFLGHFFTLLFRKTWIPDVLLLMVVGIVLGSILHLVSPVDFGKVGSVMSTITLIIILFECGTTLSMTSVMNSIRSTLAIGLTSFLATVGITIAACVHWFGMPLLPSALIGVSVGGTSSAVVIPMVKALQMREKPATLLIIESALSDVVCIVVFFAFIEGVTSGEVQIVKVLISMAASLGAAMVIGLAGGILWLLFLQSIRSFPNTIMACFAFSFVLYGIAELLDFSGPIAVLCFGVMLANFRELKIDTIPAFHALSDPEFVSITETEKAVFTEVVFYVKTIFFIYLGILIEFKKGPEVWYGAILVALIYLTRLIVTRITIDRSFTLREASLLSIMAPKGLAAAVLASIPHQNGMAYGEEIQEITFMVVLFSISLTALLVPFVVKDRLSFFYKRIFNRYPQEVPSLQTT